MRALAVVMLCGCLSSNQVVCDDGSVCASGTACAVVTIGGMPQTLCVDPGRIGECAGMADNATCTLGSCHSGVCFPNACGDKLVDPGEACDDGNTNNGDGCSADCQSTEVCGNGKVDAINGEQCDTGDPQSHDGCSSNCIT